MRYPSCRTAIIKIIKEVQKLDKRINSTKSSKLLLWKSHLPNLLYKLIFVAVPRTFQKIN